MKKGIVILLIGLLMSFAACAPLWFGAGAGAGAVGHYLYKDNYRECPHCKKNIKKAASVCPYCQRDVKPIKG
jgi:hypothetical protein